MSRMTMVSSSNSLVTTTGRFTRAPVPRMATSGWLDDRGVETGRRTNRNR